jgi:hypothetical protein
MKVVVENDFGFGQIIFDHAGESDQHSSDFRRRGLICDQVGLKFATNLVWFATTLVWFATRLVWNLRPRWPGICDHVVICDHVGLKSEPPLFRSCCRIYFPLSDVSSVNFLMPDLCVSWKMAWQTSFWFHSKQFCAQTFSTNKFETKLICGPKTICDRQILVCDQQIRICDHDFRLTNYELQIPIFDQQITIFDQN